jgi:hypothetical protein
MPQLPTVRRRFSVALAAAWTNIVRRSAPADPMAAAFAELAREMVPSAAGRPARGPAEAPQRRAA